LNRYLELYTVGATRPRIAIDDGCRVLAAELFPGGVSPLRALITGGPDSAHVLDGLVRPLALTVSPFDGSLFITDQGTPSGWNPSVAAGLWRVPPGGGSPRRVGDAALTLRFPTGVAVTAGNGHAYVVGDSGLFELVPPYTTATRKAAANAFGAPVAIAALPDGHLLVLDRGKPFQSGQAAEPALVEITLQPFSARATRLSGAVDPMSLCVTRGGRVIVGDAREPDRGTPADLLAVDRRSGACSRLLGDAVSRLVAPVAVAAEDETHLLVLDAGLKPYFPGLDSSLEPFVRHVAEPAALHRVTLGETPAVTRASEVGALVYPTGLALRGNTALVTDRGEYSDPNVAGETLRVWRALAHEFGVVVHFSETRRPSPPERRRILHDIQTIVDREKPAHTNWTMLFSSSSGEA
jgi:hypothetical protein